jgi:hypothetical protein
LIGRFFSFNDNSRANLKKKVAYNLNVILSDHAGLTPVVAAANIDYFINRVFPEIYWAILVVDSELPSSSWFSTCSHSEDTCLTITPKD